MKTLAYSRGVAPATPTVLAPLDREDEDALARLYGQHCGWDQPEEVRESVASALLADAPVSPWRPSRRA